MMMNAEIANEMIRSRSHTESMGSVLGGTEVYSLRGRNSAGLACSCMVLVIIRSVALSKTGLPLVPAPLMVTSGLLPPSGDSGYNCVLRTFAHVQLQGVQPESVQYQHV